MVGAGVVRVLMGGGGHLVGIYLVLSETRVSTCSYIICSYIRIVARDLPGGKQILAINIMAQHITFSKAIKPVKIQINFY